MISLTARIPVKFLQGITMALLAKVSASLRKVVQSHFPSEERDSSERISPRALLVFFYQGNPNVELSCPWQAARNFPNFDNQMFELHKKLDSD
jgi:hypothetical protein